MSDPSRRDLLSYGGVITAAAFAGPAVGGRALGAPAGQDGSPSPMPQLAAAWQRVPDIRQRIKPPEFPATAFDIQDYGAVGDGATDCTDAFRQAVAACADGGGGHVVVPPGSYLTGPVVLRTGVDLHVGEGATILGTTNLDAYLPNVFTRWQGIECYNYSPLIYAYGERDVAVTGTGTIDGQGSKGAWHSWKSSGPDWDALQQMAADGVPVAQRQFGGGHQLRPNMVQFYRCSNVLVSGVTLLDPVMWTVHPVLCRNVTVQGITVHSTISNGDGCDPECSSDVLISGARFDTNDDCIAIKSGRDADGRRVNVPSQDILIEDCDFSGRWGGVTIGSEMSGGVRNVFARRCRINPADFPGRYPVKYALYGKTNQARGGFIEDIYLDGITGTGLERQAVYVTMNYSGGANGTFYPAVEKIGVSRLVVDGAQAALALDGLAGDHMSQVILANSRFTGITGTDTVDNADQVTVFNVTENGQEV